MDMMFRVLILYIMNYYALIYSLFTNAAVQQGNNLPPNNNTKSTTIHHIQTSFRPSFSALGIDQLNSGTTSVPFCNNFVKRNNIKVIKRI